ncbi:MAG: hypothetical protein AAF871_06640 [Pseudomonadota bacterium]
MSEPRITLYPARRDASSVPVTETHWGYILREAERPWGGVALAEASCRFLGLVLVIAAYAQWLIPASLFPSDPLSTKISLSIILSVGGAGVYYLANRGLRREVQVDTAERQVRFARRSVRGRPNVIRVVPFEAISGVFVNRREGGAELCLRLEGFDTSVRLASGVERDLNLLHARLCRDFKTAEQRMEARLGIERARLVPVRLGQRRVANG